MAKKAQSENPVNVALLIITIVSLAVAAGTVVVYFVGNGKSPQAVETDESPDVAAFEERLSENPRDMEALLGLGHIHLDQGRYDLASEMYQQALEVDSANVEALSHMANILRDTGRAADAIENYNKALVKNPDYAHGWWDKALALRLTGDHEEAIVAWQEFLRLVPTGDDAENAKKLMAESQAAKGKQSTSTTQAAAP